ncbi:hypothetical protein MMF94_15340 [Pseudonocardia alaniniphila]|uniref:Uncharacterized protein n=1 Tax=Pseudonocardia alaniniphila TaxID=75291 RepID=A0ABS9TEV2_9PSEU|nr:hypothetical protein [Pseudonocardia alaniniphila]MCH6167060.1 hypothetical protein [Pseudonocardia alaniniphila]
MDWEQRVDLDGLRGDRLRRLRGQLEKPELGAVLAFDFTNIRYMTATHIGTWAIDKLIRFSLLVRGGEPIVWDFGSAARHHQLYAPWLDYSGAQVEDPHAPHHGATPLNPSGARAGISTLREREDHALLEHLRVLQRHQPGEDRLLPDRQPYPVPVLQGERGLLVREAELLGRGPDRHHVRGGGTGPHQGDRLVHVLAAPRVRVSLGGEALPTANVR